MNEGLAKIKRKRKDCFFFEEKKRCLATKKK